MGDSDHTVWDFYQSDTPWGPWSPFFTKDFNGDGFYIPTAPSKWISADGTSLWLIFAGDYNTYDDPWNTTKYTLHVQEMTLTLGSATNLLTNPGFEAGESPWFQWQPATQADAHVRNQTSPHSGSWSMGHTSANAYQQYTAQLVTGLTNGTYRLSGWIKSSGGYNNVILGAKNFGGTEMKNYLPKTAFGWTRYELPNIRSVTDNAKCTFGAIHRQATSRLLSTTWNLLKPPNTGTHNIVDTCLALETRSIAKGICMSTPKITRRRFLRTSTTAVGAAVLAACGGAPSANDAAPAASSAGSSSVGPTTAAASTEKVVLQVHVHDNHPFDKIKPLFEAKHPNITLNMLKQSDMQAFRATLAANGEGTPDLVWPETFDIQDLGKAGVLLDVSDIVDKHKLKLAPGKVAECYIPASGHYVAFPAI
jgi:hypothetical protein